MIVALAPRNTESARKMWLTSWKIGTQKRRQSASASAVSWQPTFFSMLLLC